MSLESSVDTTFREIANLSTMLPKEQTDYFLDKIRAVEQREKQEGVHEGIQRALNAIMSELRNVLPVYETLTLKDFKSLKEINAVTMGYNFICFEKFQNVSIPPGTRLIKPEGLRALGHFKICFDNGVEVSVSTENFPSFGFRIKPRSTI